MSPTVFICYLKDIEISLDFQFIRVDDHSKHSSLQKLMLACFIIKINVRQYKSKMDLQKKNSNTKILKGLATGLGKKITRSCPIYNFQIYKEIFLF